MRHSDGTLFKPDLVVHRASDDVIAGDVQVSWKGVDGLAGAWEAKGLVYDQPKFREAAAIR